MILDIKSREFFEWRFGRIFYRYSEGQIPVILIHNTNGSSERLYELTKEMPSKYAVYAMDLPGFGCSVASKSLNAYLLAAGIRDFGNYVKSLFPDQKLYLIACGGGVPFALGANLIEPGLFEQVVAINPSNNLGYLKSDLMGMWKKSQNVKLVLRR